MDKEAREKSKVEYVFPHFKRQEKEIKEIKGISRLFAYPKTPHYSNEGKIVILDSGAFGLSTFGHKITKPYMNKMDKHYRKNVRGNTLCIAPDQFLNPVQSMLNVKIWYDNSYYPHITAVLQSKEKKRIDLKELFYQVDYYSNFTDEFCFSNNALTGEMAKIFNLRKLFKYMKEEKGVKWIHILGAGWNVQDIKDWLDIGYFDSMDSIAYYQPSSENQFGSLDPVKNIYNIRKVVDDYYI